MHISNIKAAIRKSIIIWVIIAINFNYSVYWGKTIHCHNSIDFW